MAETTNISWADATFSGWTGCTKVSPACKHCYAETFVRTRRGLRIWGADGQRPIGSVNVWRAPLLWNKRAGEGKLLSKSLDGFKVFASSLADVYEDFTDPVTGFSLDEPRVWMHALIEATPHLDWMLLTKRPGNINRMVPRYWAHVMPLDERQTAFGRVRGEPVVLSSVWTTGYTCAPEWPSNAWVGTTVESSAYLWRVDELRKVPAPRRFISAEPLLGDLTDLDLRGIHMVIVGGEQSPDAAMMKLEWVERIKDKCDKAGVAFHAKQLGNALARELGKRAPGGELTDFPPHLQVRQWAETVRR